MTLTIKLSIRLNILLFLCVIKINYIVQIWVDSIVLILCGNNVPIYLNNKYISLNLYV